MVAHKGETFEIFHSVIRWSRTVCHERMYHLSRKILPQPTRRWYSEGLRISIEQWKWNTRCMACIIRQKRISRHLPSALAIEEFYEFAEFHASFSLASVDWKLLCETRMLNGPGNKITLKYADEGDREHRSLRIDPHHRWRAVWLYIVVRMIERVCTYHTRCSLFSVITSRRCIDAGLLILTCKHTETNVISKLIWRKQNEISRHVTTRWIATRVERSVLSI